MLTLVYSLVLHFAAASATERPILGVLAQETSANYQNFGSSYIPAAYVKAIEASGARVVPIFIGEKEFYYESLLQKVNGVVFPGGSVNLKDCCGHAAAGKLIYNAAVKMNDEGDYFPILGVCQGLQLLLFLASHENYNILSKCESFEALTLEFKEDFRNSTLFRDAPGDIVAILETLPVTSNHHRLCVTEESLKVSALNEDWRVLSTNTEHKGLKFISTSESRSHPFVGLQFHPEKNAYEWNVKQTFNPHYYDGILAGRFFYDWIVNEARKSNHSFTSQEEELEHLIYNYDPVYLGRHGAYIEQAYFFNNSNCCNSMATDIQY